MVSILFAMVFCLTWLVLIIVTAILLVHNRDRVGNIKLTVFGKFEASFDKSDETQ